MASKTHKFVWYKKAFTEGAAWERTQLGGDSVSEANDCMHHCFNAKVFACNATKLVNEAAGEQP